MDADHFLVLQEDVVGVLNDDARRLCELAIGLGFTDQPNEPAEAAFRREFDDRMRETRATVQRLFYETR